MAALPVSQMAYDDVPQFLTLFFLEGIFHLDCHERIRILFKDAQAGAGAKIDALTAIHGAGIMHGVFQYAIAGSFIFGRFGICLLSQFSFSLRPEL